ncbi:sigma-70 family RNA polymerase sigma factor [Streptomyces sp. IB2014 016-6]|uniref:sigma-70 family RNA polymerase sigma factor n=1 Tax=Streptomyces sp. IB2014 016-6 TaxID=2517818 RepID=UPI001F501F45|nr:sigma-70 family RNA polymerase sigma factor [Streptomyces sp. IB2014 016-6]
MEYALPPALEAFHDLYVKAYLNYAHSMLGDKDAAFAVVHRCFSHLALNWPKVMRSESPEAYAWALLKVRVDTHLRLSGQESQMVETVAFQRTARAVLEGVRCQFEVMETSLGLYTAIASLPERQYDVIVLLYVLGYPSDRVASIMGVKRDTVRSHRRLAKRRIAKRLSLPLHADADEEKE